MKKCLLLIALFFVSSVTMFAQVIDKSGKQNVSVDYTRLSRIDSLVNNYVENDWVKGVVTLVIKDNQLVQYKGYGYLDADTKKPMPNDAIFRIMSQTKSHYQRRHHDAV
jgi:CubicO group peptidase (beta-lactamase class C family)